ncbi:MAG TPA: hypothetical protein VF635_12125 [Propionibacteriaceae bacterium]|jgi:hypothetical protein
MEILGLWTVAGALLLSAVVFGWVTITTHPLASALAHRRGPQRREDLVRRACADIDDEYRRLLEH